MAAILREFSFLFILFCLISPSLAVAQTAKGAISGQVADKQGAVLHGARVTLNNGISTATDIRGQFHINNLDAGEYKVSVSYVGFQQYTTHITVSPGQVASVTADLAVASARTEMTVYADRQFGEAEAINRARTSPNILVVLPADGYHQPSER